MESKYSFWQLLGSEEFGKIEIPILQRDYAQGRNTREVSRIRKQFSDYLIQALCANDPVELDFVYGSSEKQNTMGSEKVDSVFIPLDGQQRLTTLFLLHWYFAAKEGKLGDWVKEKLEKFSYETRPSAHDFCRELIRQGNYSENLKTDIRDASWYNDEWNYDPTVIGMLTMLDTFQDNEILQKFTKENPDTSLFDRLISEKPTPVITFYFVPLKKFGLTEDLYIRMNARGKMLNDFENFKSEFYKIISCHENLCKDFKEKIEYGWVEILWEFRDKKKFIVDKAFMNYLRFITEMLYFKQSEVRAESYESFGADELTNFEVLKDVFTKEDNLAFLIFSLDKIGLLRQINAKMFWSDTTTLCQFIENILIGKNGKNIDISSQIILYATLRYLYKIPTNKIDKNYFDYVRVIRNLTHNTNDKSRREWARILNSIELLISTDNIYITKLLQPDANKLMIGFSNPQCEEEIFKANIIKHNPHAKDILFRTEDNNMLRGNITSLLRASYTKSTEHVKNISLSNCNPEKIEITRLEKILKSYEKLSEDGFIHIRGDTLDTEVYFYDAWRIRYRDEYKKHDSMIQLVLEYDYSEYDKVDDFAISIEKDFIRKISGPIAEIRDVRQQLYLYYILTVRIMGKGKSEFFCNGFNFGFLPKEKGFSSLFNGIGGNQYYTDKSPIYQTYSSQFRYNLGLQEKNALPPEIVGRGRINNPFERLIEWSNE